jgi:hypothetical protein
MGNWCVLPFACIHRYMCLLTIIHMLVATLELHVSTIRAEHFLG